jgi:hypothetical protein
MFFGGTSYLIFMLPAILLMMVAQWYVNSAYSKWSKVRNGRNITGADAADQLRRAGGLHDVRIEQVGGRLSDHYDPRQKVLRLSAGVAQTPSVAALAIAAHELGHAMQDKENYGPLRFRAALVPVVNVGSYLGWILILLGLFIGITGLAWLGVAVFAGGAVFALATLPVELDASARARRLLADTGLTISEDERRGVSRVLNAAAWTYVAGLVTAILQLLYYASLVTGMGRRR